MAFQSVNHNTLTIERNFAVDIDALYSAFTDVEIRKKWGAPPGVTLHYDQADFSIGGIDKFECSVDGQMVMLGSVRYENIITNQCVVFVETLSDGDNQVSSALCTCEFRETKQGASLLLTLQIAAFGENEVLEDYQEGWTGALELLKELLTK